MVRYISHLPNHRPERVDWWNDRGKECGGLSGSNLFFHADLNALQTLDDVLDRATKHEEGTGDGGSDDLEKGKRRATA